MQNSKQPDPREKEMWDRMISMRQELEDFYDQLKTGYDAMDDDDFAAMPKHTLNMVMFMLAATMFELCRRHSIELARIRDSN